ncbi:transposon Ty3-I Gag-Pol polyprotein [Elysia marginata]|uniref:Transposon Ty3-I Gag-Pol polyprotein n=1 Tax=Elysia marginata TaxID=1093978 RepID=A0AAV4JXP8_9GAST|nr:transposon Ty3-I Gag-Pol polyprotein [Elysia marginata]
MTRQEGTLRFRLNSRQQAESETLDQFVTALKLLAEGCEFGGLQPSLIRDRVICGTKECSIKERLLQEDDPMLEKALKIARSLEASKLDLSSMKTAVRVHAVRAPRKEKSQIKTNSRQPPHILKQHQHQKHNQAQTSRSYPQKDCPNCGNLPHHQSQCPARGQMCNYCKKPNHFKKTCRKLKFNQKKTHNIDPTSDSDDQYEEGATCSFETIQLNFVRTTDDEAYVILNVNLLNFPDKKTTLKAKIDTGSQGNALPMRLYEKMFPDGLDRLTKSRTKITAYGGSQVKNYDTCKIQYAKCGYWNVVLDKESSRLTAFNPPFGRYKFLRMPFGLKMSQDIFQSKIDQTFEGCSGVIGIADDIVVSGKTEKEHDENLRKMIQRCEETGLKLNPDKCKIKQEQIKFYGVICCAQGLKPDPEKVKSLQSMKAPENIKELQSFLGLTTYMSPFIPNSSSRTAPLRELLLKSSNFEWTPNHEKVFKDIKDSISKEVTLAYFDPDKPITVQVDASMKALGASLIQEGKPVAFACKALTDEETRYANIERELLAVVYGCERFHTYLCVQAFTVESDHKPLKSIHLKHLKAASPRLQRMLLRLQPYDLTIEYKPGKEMALADALSRLTSSEDPPIKGINVKVHQVFTQFSDSCLLRIKDATSTDSELNALKRDYQQRMA